MEKNKILNNFSEKSIKIDATSHTNFLRDNVRKYMDENDLTVHEFSEKADIPYSTLQNILYKDAGCRLETAISIAKAMGIGVDELANTKSMSDLAFESVQIVRKLPNHIQLLIHRYIRWQKTMHETFKHNPGKVIDVMNMDYENEHLITTNDFEKVDISEFPIDIKAKVFRGMRIPCDEYLEFYQENDILLLCDDRKPRHRERCVILYYNRVYIVQKDCVNGVSGFKGIRGTIAFIPENEITYYFGYVCGVKHG